MPTTYRADGGATGAGALSRGVCELAHRTALTFEKGLKGDTFTVGIGAPTLRVRVDRRHYAALFLFEALCDGSQNSHIFV